MKTATYARILFSFFLFFMSACSAQQQPAPTAVPTNTPDPCGVEALPGEIDKVHKHMREFDDASLLAANTPRDQLTLVISDMQRIRRGAEDQIVPSCLATLKQVQLVYMKTVIETLVSFLGGPNQEILNQGIELARQQHNQYALEYARLLGITMVAPTAGAPIVAPTDTPTDTPQPVITVNYVAVNSSAENMNLFSEPSENAAIVAVLLVGESTKALSQSSDGQWLIVEIPGQPDKTAWILASKVSLVPSP